jgi:hypothetical protein
MVHAGGEIKRETLQGRPVVGSRARRRRRIVGLWLRPLRRGDNTSGRANPAADQRTGQRAWTTADGRTNRGATTGANQRAARRPLAGIVRVGAGGYREHQADRGGALKTSVHSTANHRDTPFPLDAILDRQYRDNGNTRDKCRAWSITYP